VSSRSQNAESLSGAHFFGVAAGPGVGEVAEAGGAGSAGLAAANPKVPSAPSATTAITCCVVFAISHPSPTAALAPPLPE
jgi:hypothetical protein